jgi:hypothetical protein
MAIDILSISPINDKSKRIFSEARRTVTWDKEQIEIETIELKECLKY